MVNSVDAQGKPVVKIRMSNDHSKWAVVDKSDAEWLKEGTWSCTPQGYVVWTVRQGRENLRVLMHGVVFGASKGQLVDHWDHDTFNNRNGNLRLADKSKNGQNKLKYLRNGKASSRFKGVRWHPGSKAWHAYIVPPNNNRRQKHLGTFKTQIAAARAYNISAQKYFGVFAYLNPI